MQRAEQLSFIFGIRYELRVEHQNTIMTGGGDASNNNIFLTTENLAFSLPLIAVCFIYVSCSVRFSEDRSSMRPVFLELWGFLFDCLFNKIFLTY
jgi:hypothetical protein